MTEHSLHGRDPGREGYWSGGDVDALLQEWREGAAAKAAHRALAADSPAKAREVEYHTITVVVTDAEVTDVTRTLQRHPDVLFTHVQEGVSPAALKAGAHPDDWVV